MFLVNSRPGLFTAASILFEALLLPKLRSDFAEFLNERSLKHLWILSSSTCVGLRYGLYITEASKAFPGRVLITLSLQAEALSVLSLAL